MAEYIRRKCSDGAEYDATSTLNRQRERCAPFVCDLLANNFKEHQLSFQAEGHHCPFDMSALPIGSTHSSLGTERS